MDDARPALLLSFDVEDWHQLVHRRYGRPDWDRRAPALERQLASILALLDDLGARATFFVLGITADRYPDLIQRIAERGHELGCHGYTHARVYDQTPDEFADDLARASDVVAGLWGRHPVAYRAPAFSI